MIKIKLKIFLLGKRRQKNGIRVGKGHTGGFN